MGNLFEVSIPNQDEDVKVGIKWAGGEVTNHQFRRAVNNYQKLKHYDEIKQLVSNGRKRGQSNSEISDELNAKGYRPPSERSSKFNRGLVAQLVCRLRLATPRRKDLLKSDEWWLREFAEHIQTTANRVRYWVKHGTINWRRLSGRQIVVWADAAEISRLEKLRDWPSSTQAPAHLRTPKSPTIEE